MRPPTVNQENRAPEAPVFRLVPTDARDIREAINTFTVYDGDNAIGRVSGVGITDWRITYAGLGVTNYSRAARHLSRNEAVRELVHARNIARATRTTESGLTGLQEDVLLAAKEIGADATDDLIGRAAAKLALSPTNFKQILFALLDDERAEAFLPLSIPVMREARAAMMAKRQARFTPRAAVAAA
jgi:hypothetical protein